MAMGRTDTSTERPRSRPRRLSADRTGQVSFAVIAVVILTATAVTGSYMAMKELDRTRDERRQGMLDAMDQAAAGVAQELSLRGASSAHQVVAGWDEFPVNESRITDAYSNAMSDYISVRFPRTDERFEIVVDNWTGGLFMVEKKTIDIVPSDAASPANITVDGASMDYEKQAASPDEELGERTVNPYYVAVGNFTVKVSASDLVLLKQSSFERPVVSALPFLEAKLRAFESSSDGELSDLGSMVSYMLTTLAQLRVLEGYGQPMYSGLDSEGILTEEDVHRAVGVGLLLEQARLFRSIDESFAAEVASLCGGGDIGLAAVLSEKCRELDPAELFLWFLGKTGLELDSETVVAQAVYGLGDQLFVKIMEYMGWLGALDAVKDVLDYLGDKLDSLVSYLTGEDKAHATVVSWLTRTLEMTGAAPSTYSSLYSNSCDFWLTVPENQYFVEDAAGNLYPVWVGNITAEVDIPEYDLMAADAWSGFYDSFKECQASFTSFVQDSMARLAFDLAAAARLEIGSVYVDPADGVGLFQALASGTGDVEIVLDPAVISNEWRSLPFFSAQYEVSRRFWGFVEENTEELSQADGLLSAVWSDVASSIVSSARYAYIPDLAVPVEVQIGDLVRFDIEHDLDWGVGSAAASVMSSLSRMQLERLRSLVNSSVSKLDDGFAGPVVDSVASLLLFGSEEFEGLGEFAERVLQQTSLQVLSQRELSSFKEGVDMCLGSGFQFWDGDRASAELSGRILVESVSAAVPGGYPSLQTVPYEPELGYGSIEALFPTDSVLVQVQRPWQYDRSETSYPNVHLTSLANSSATPYTTQWKVSVLGMVEIALESENSALLSASGDEDASSTRQVKIQLSFPVVVHSAWPIDRVEYNPSNTALSDALAVARKFCDMVWDKLEPVFGWVKTGLERIYRFVTDVFEVLVSYATKVIKLVSAVMQRVVETLQEFVQKIANSALAKAVKALVDITGRVELRISLFGFTFIIQTLVPDLLYRTGDDMLRVIVCTDRFGPSMSFGVRVARLSDGSWDVLANGTIVLKKVTIDVRVDPLMHIMRRFVEVHCTGRSWAMDLTMPEVEPYEIAEVSTASIPGVGAFLSNIPIPVAGLSASVEAGLRLKYSPPFPDDIVVNEFESNPRGEDSGREWVELYNPLDEPRCVDGWSVATVHGKSSAVPVKGTVPANGLLVVTFPETAIDNGVPDDPFNDGDAIVLLDPAGATVDITPMLKDTQNDERTVQRCWDGGPRWVFELGSKGSSNGAPVLLATSDFIAKALFEAFKEAFMQTQLQEVTASLDFLVMFMKRVIINFIENLLSLVKEIIHEITLYIKVLVGDASGSAGVGFRASFVVKGEAIVELLRWLIFSLATFIVNLGRASNPIAYPAFPTSFFSGLFLRFELLFEVGLPKMVRLLGAVGPLDSRFSCAIAISPNIPALGKLAGRNWGDWAVEFGVYLEGVPREFASGFLTKDTGDLIDFWMVKGRAYGL